MKTLTMTKARISLLWYAINEDCERVDPNTGRISPLVPIVGGKVGRFFNKLMASIEVYFPNGETPQLVTHNGTTTRVEWQLEFPDEAMPIEGQELSNVSPIRPKVSTKAKEFPFHLGNDEFELAKRFVEALTRNRLNRNPLTRDLLTELDDAFENATEYTPPKEEKATGG